VLSGLPGAPLATASFVQYCLGELERQGWRRVVTGAIGPLEQAAYLAAGFEVEERLVLLSLALDDPPPRRSGQRTRRVGRRHIGEVLAVDRAAFDEFWRFDEANLADALAATPSARFRRFANIERDVGGYAVCGRAGRRGYVQRLAVHPDQQGRGAGRALLGDGLSWMHRHGVNRVFVNTSPTNTSALALYRSSGFVEEQIGLAILSRPVGS
jgi:ribosomal protein S18 acetylase RimI-like enzyme